MLTKDISLPKKFLDALGVEKLNPPQVAALESGLLNGKSLVIAAPTASGKTLIAELAIIKNFINAGKTLYIVPLRALASEKYHEFKEKYQKLGMKIALSIGDLDNSDDWLGNYDLMVISNEKADSLLRHGVKWLSDITLIVTDEIHMLNDPSRGPTLEIVITRLRTLTNSQILALSATISNAEEIADWLSAELVQSSYRPIKLHHGVCYPEFTEDDELKYTIDFIEKRNEIMKGNGDCETVLTEHTLGKQKQALIFLSTRRSAEAVAEKLSKNIYKLLQPEEKKKLLKIAQELENALPHPTKQCRRLGKIVKGGASFHHAGLVAKQRKLIEDNFRSGVIKILTATPTLAFGVNLPAWRVLIRDVKRYTSYGYQFIPTLEVMQMMGRAGRPTYDKDGEAIIIAKSKQEASEMKERYILSESEAIVSKLSNEVMLRMHTLALVAGETCRSKHQLLEFFSKTFFAYQYKDLEEIEKKLEKILKDLEGFGFIGVGEEDERFISSEFIPAFELARDQKLRATRVGKRVSELYIDPLSAWQIIQELRVQHDIAYLMTITQCIEMQPTMRVRSGEYDEYGEELAKSPLTNIPDVWDIDYDEYLSAFKTSMMFQDWTNELTEDRILEKYNMPPGELYTKITNAEWLLYAAKELAVLMERKEVANRLNKLLLRVKNGVREELLPLIRIRGIGRVRARMLWNNRLRTTMDLKKVNPELLSEILGIKLAKSVKEELNKPPKKLR